MNDKWNQIYIHRSSGRRSAGFGPNARENHRDARTSHGRKSFSNANTGPMDGPRAHGGSMDRGEEDDMTGGGRNSRDRDRERPGRGSGTRFPGQDGAKRATGGHGGKAHGGGGKIGYSVSASNSSEFGMNNSTSSGDEGQGHARGGHGKGAFPAAHGRHVAASDSYSSDDSTEKLRAPKHRRAGRESSQREREGRRQNRMEREGSGYTRRHPSAQNDVMMEGGGRSFKPSSAFQFSREEATSGRIGARATIMVRFCSFYRSKQQNSRTSYFWWCRVRGWLTLLVRVVCLRVREKRESSCGIKLQLKILAKNVLIDQAAASRLSSWRVD